MSNDKPTKIEVELSDRINRLASVMADYAESLEMRLYTMREVNDALNETLSLLEDRMVKMDNSMNVMLTLAGKDRKELNRRRLKDD